MSLPKLPLVFLSFLLVLSSVVDAGRLYRWVDDNGVTHFSDEEPESGAERVFPSGMSVIPMRGNIRTQKNVERIKKQESRRSPAPTSPAQVSSNASERKEYEKKREEERQRQLCQGYEERIDWIDSRLRAGNYSVNYGNRLRTERRELSSTRSWECLRSN